MQYNPYLWLNCQTFRVFSDELCFVSIRLQSVRSHPLSYIADTNRNTVLKFRTRCGMAETAVALSVISVEVGFQTMYTNQLKLICRV